MSYLDPDGDATLHRLEGSTGNEKGGLVIMKKGPAKTDDDEKHVFKAPTARISLLGLDRLAAEKRKEAEEKGSSKSKVMSYKGDWEDEEIEDENRDKHDEYSHKDRWH